MTCASRADWSSILERDRALRPFNGDSLSLNMQVRLTIQVLFLVGAVGVLSSCGVFSSKTPTHLLYVSTGQGIYGYRIDNKSGTSNPLPPAPFYAGNTPAGMVIDASGNHMYLANQTDNTISLLTIDHSSGVLTEVMPRTA